MTATALPPYTVRRSAKARLVRLTVTPKDGLVVVVPERWAGDTDAIVAEKREWAETALARVAEKHALHAGGPDALLPDTVVLRALNEEWPVEYRATRAAGCKARTDGGAIAVTGNIDDGEACLAALSRWLDRTAREELLPMLAEVSAEVELPYAGARVRNVRSRWGSCSSRKTISLNRNLVFLPNHLVRTLMLHELAHTLVMDHSAKFWDTLAVYDRRAQINRSELKRAGQYVPPWAEL
jgi:predicted metal-dependent hydrolase